MKLQRVIRGTPAVVFFAILSAVVPARAEYGNGAFAGVFTVPGGTGSFTLQNGAPFPQLTTGDYVPADADNHVVSVRNGVQVDYYLTGSELGGGALTGSMRFTLFWLDTPSGPRILTLGTYTLNLDGPGGTYAVSGPLAGDGFTIYLPGRDTFGTPDPGDDERFLLKVHAAGVGAGPDYLMGRVQYFFGSEVLATMNEATAVATTNAGATSFLAAPGLLSASRFNQVVPPDGTGDFTLADDTAAAFLSGMTRSGTIGADPYATVTHVLRLVPGGASGTGIVLNRFTRTLPGGATMEGFSLLDLAPAVAGESAYEGHIFAFVTGQAVPALYLGTNSGTVTNAGASGTVVADLFAVDSTPPELPRIGDVPDLFADRFQRLETYVWDFNGWQDVKSVQLLVNDTRAVNRIVARYDARRNRLSLYNRATRRWVGRCAPGTAGTLRTPWVSLSCADTEVLRSGEYLAVAWNIRPGARMLPVASPNAYVKAADRAGQVAGWRSIRDGVPILATGP